MKVCRKCGAEVNSDNCCENGALVKKVTVAKAPAKRRSRAAVQEEKTGLNLPLQVSE
jgi:hypothetical protein